MNKHNIVIVILLIIIAALLLIDKPADIHVVHDTTQRDSLLIVIDSLDSMILHKWNVIEEDLDGVRVDNIKYNTMKPDTLINHLKRLYP